MWSQQSQVFAIGPSSTATFTLQRNAPLERCTIWANSGRRPLVNASFQVQINGTNYGAPVAVAGAPAADVIYRSGGAATEDDLIPYVSPAAAAEAGVDPFEVSVVITNNDAAAAVRVTVHAVGLTHAA